MASFPWAQACQPRLGKADCAARESVTRLCGKKSESKPDFPLVTCGQFTDFWPQFNSQDLRLTKAFQVARTLRIAGFAEAFNIFNFSNLTYISPPTAAGSR